MLVPKGKRMRCRSCAILTVSDGQNLGHVQVLQRVGLKTVPTQRASNMVMQPKSWQSMAATGLKTAVPTKDQHPARKLAVTRMALCSPIWSDVICVLETHLSNHLLSTSRLPTTLFDVSVVLSHVYNVVSTEHTSNQ